MLTSKPRKVCIAVDVHVHADVHADACCALISLVNACLSGRGAGRARPPRHIQVRL